VYCLILFMCVSICFFTSCATTLVDEYEYVFIVDADVTLPSYSFEPNSFVDTLRDNQVSILVNAHKHTIPRSLPSLSPLPSPLLSRTPSLQVFLELCCYCHSLTHTQTHTHTHTHTHCYNTLIYTQNRNFIKSPSKRT
jgi:hypothetical protein